MKERRASSRGSVCVFKKSSIISLGCETRILFMQNVLYICEYKRKSKYTVGVADVDGGNRCTGPVALRI